MPEHHCMIAASSTFTARDGNGYELQMGRWSRRLAPLLIDFSGIVRAERVLDAGCGTGNLALALARNPAIRGVLGIDLAPAYIAYAKDRNSGTRIEFQVADACALPFADGSFDHALSMLALQFMPQAQLAVREMRRVTRPGGTVAGATWDARGGLVAHRMILDTAALLDRAGNTHRARACTRPMSRPGALAQAWRDAGLADVIQDMLTIRMDFDSFADFWASSEGRDGPVADYVATLDERTRDRLREAVECAYLDGDPDGPRSYAATAWIVKGRVPI